MTKKDYYIAALIGFLIGVFAIPTLLNLGLHKPAYFIALIVVLPIVWAAGVWFGIFLSRWLPFLAQFTRFVAVGFLNTAIDFGVLNILSILTGITAGLVVGGVNIPGVAVAVINGYFWNKYWVFKNGGQGGIFEDFPQFLAVTVIGIIINGGIIVAITTYIPPVFAVKSSTWLNMAKVVATAVSLIWNFIGYKFIVFKPKGPPTPAGIPA